MRRKTLVLAILLPLLLLSTFGATLNPREPPLAAAATSSAKQLWSASISQSTVQSPVLYGGLIYVAATPSNSSTTSLYCFNASTGDAVWSRTDYYSSFTVADDRVYIGATVLAAALYSQGVVYCLNASSGAQLWKTDVTGYVIGAPTVAGNSVYVSANMFTINTDTATGHVYALNAQTGAEIWDFTGSLGTSFDSPTVENGTVYAVSAYTTVNDEDAFTGALSSVYAIQADTGAKLWNCSVQALFGSLILAGGDVYVNCNYYNATEAADLISDYYAGGVLCFSGQNGQLLWNDTFPQVANFFAVADGAVYLVSDDELISGHSNVLPDSGFVYALDAADGTVQWNQTVDQSLGSAAFADGYLYVGSTEGVYCFSSADGKVIWNFAVGGYYESSPTYPAYADGVVYVGWNGPAYFAPENEHYFYALKAATGQQLWSTSLPYTVTSAPLAANGTVYVAASATTMQGQSSVSGGAVLVFTAADTSPLAGCLAISLIAAAVVIVAAAAVLLLAKTKKLGKPSS